MERKIKVWGKHEELKFLSIWEASVSELRATKRRRRVYEKMSRRLHELGIIASRLCVQTKVNNLTQRYRNELRIAKLSNISSEWALFKPVQKIVRSLSTNDVSKVPKRVEPKLEENSFLELEEDVEIIVDEPMVLSLQPSILTKSSPKPQSKCECDESSSSSSSSIQTSSQKPTQKKFMIEELLEELLRTNSLIKDELQQIKGLIVESNEIQRHRMEIYKDSIGKK